MKRGGGGEVVLKSLVADGFKSTSEWLVVDSFDDPAVAKWLKPVLPLEDEMEFLFGEHQVVFKKVNRDRIQVFLDGKEVSPVIESDNRTSRTEAGTEMLNCSECQIK